MLTNGKGNPSKTKKTWRRKKVFIEISDREKICNWISPGRIWAPHAEARPLIENCERAALREKANSCLVSVVHPSKPWIKEAEAASVLPRSEDREERREAWKAYQRTFFLMGLVPQRSQKEKWFPGVYHCVTEPERESKDRSQFEQKSYKRYLEQCLNPTWAPILFAKRLGSSRNSPGTIIRISFQRRLC